ncbi:MAG: outer membrane protein assembly factor BamD [Planctomycetes bacterium]|nr:outer membrane protein assembly factor BamD [Planctomycetota bacterium]
MRPTPRRLTIALLPAFVACSTPPVPIPDDPRQALDLAQAFLERDEPNTTIGILDALDEDVMTNDERARAEALRIQALYRTKDYWEAFRVARGFVEQHRFSELAGTIEEFEFRTGRALIQDDDDDGVTVLQHFVERFPASTYAAEAYKLLGEFAFAEEDYAIAEVRFSDLLRSHPTSEWAAFARFRLAITAFLRVRGPEYDFAQMTLARNELRDYLALDPERPEFRREAQQALAKTEAWLARRHLIIADFYRTVGSAAGERMHLRRASESFPGTPAGQTAATRLGRLGPEATP